MYFMINYLKIYSREKKWKSTPERKSTGDLPTEEKDLEKDYREEKYLEMYSREEKYLEMYSREEKCLEMNSGEKKYWRCTQ